MKLILSTFAILLSFSSHAVIIEGDDQYEVCREIKKYAYSKTICRPDYHLFKPKKIVSKEKSTLKIAGFNLLQPGTKVSRYKHLPSIITMMNKWDVIGATELMAFDRYTEDYNNYVLKALGNARKRATKKRLKSMYRVPGYLTILMELQKRDPSWGLILTPTKQGSPSASIREVTGIYYRASVATPIHNKYCAKAYGKRSRSYGCLPKFEESIENDFSRKPLIASFESKDFKYTLLSSHVVFGGSSIKPRLKELSHTTNLMNNELLNETTNKVILIGDLNLETKDRGMLEALNGFDIFQDDLSSVSAQKGYSKNFDHFVFNQSKVPECDGEGAEVYDMLTKVKIFDKYEPMFVEAFQCKKNRFGKIANMEDYEVKNLQDVYCQYMGRRSNTKKVNWKGEIIWEHNDRTLEKFSGKFISTIVKSQNSIAQKYRRYMSVLSDHAPISMKCSLN